jgi:hypothetical protein
MTDALESHLLSQTDDPTRLFWHRLRWRFVAAHLPCGPFTLLDVGAGSGVTGEFLARSRPEATYTFDEPIESLRTLLRARHGERADLHGVDPLPRVDVVTLLDVLEHLTDDRAFLADLVARLEPATTIIVTVPASPRLWSAWDEALGHVRRYEFDALAALLATAPVVVDETGHLFPEMVPAAWWRARRRPATGPATGGSAAEFPDLPWPVDRMLELLGRPGVRWRTSIPFGTSLCAVARVRPA